MASKKIKCIDGAAYKAQATAQADSIVQEAAVWAAIQVAMMLAQRSSSGAIADMQAELASRRVVMAEEALAHAKLTWAKEKAFVDEMMAVPVFTPQYLQAQQMLNEADRVEGLALTGIDAALARLGITTTACDESRPSRGMATARTDLVSHTMRAAEARAIALNDRRYSRQLAAVGLGKGTLQNAKAMGALADGAGAVRDSLIRTINSGMSLWGYSANRWRHGGNYITGENGAPTVVPTGQTRIETTGPNGYSKMYTVPDAVASRLTGEQTGITVRSTSGMTFGEGEY
jgi:hypothetical protein